MQQGWLSLSALNLSPETQTCHTWALIVKEDEKYSKSLAGQSPPVDIGNRNPQACAMWACSCRSIIPEARHSIESEWMMLLISSKLINQSTKTLAELLGVSVVFKKITYCNHAIPGSFLVWELSRKRWNAMQRPVWFSYILKFVHGVWKGSYSFTQARTLILHLLCATNCRNKGVSPTEKGMQFRIGNT